MSDQTPGPDERRDARLLAALRQAPDHAVQAPAALARSIRTAAHAAVQPPPQAPWWAGLRSAWRAIGEPRPVWAGATAVLVVSVLTMRLWVDEPTPAAVEASAPALPVAEAPAMAKPGGAESPTPAAAPAPMPAPAKPEATVAAARRAAPLQPGGSHAEKVPAAPKLAVASAPTSARHGAAANEARPTDDAGPAAGESGRRPRTDGSIAVEPPTAAAPAPVRTQDTAATDAPAAALSRPAAPGQAAAPAVAAPPSRGEVAKLRLAAPATNGLAKAPMPARPPALEAWLLAARSDANDPAWPLTPQQRAVLRMLDLGGGSRWIAAPQAQAMREAGPDSRVLTLRSGQGSTASLQLEASGARWTEPDGTPWFLSLGPEPLQRLRLSF